MAGLALLNGCKGSGSGSLSPTAEANPSGVVDSVNAADSLTAEQKRNALLDTALTVPDSLRKAPNHKAPNQEEIDSTKAAKTRKK